MGFFSKLKAAFSGAAARPTTAAPASVAHGPSWRIVLTELGVAGPTCPYCGHVFEKMPRRKRSCPKCSGVLFSRKRAIDGTKVLLTEAQSRDGEAQEALMALTQEGVSDADLDELVRALQAQLGRVPTADDVVTRHLARSAAAHAEALHWGLYRNARFRLAESCARRGLREDALRLFLEVSLIDLNGPRNCGTTDPEFLRRFPPFDPKSAFLAPGVIALTVDLIAELEFSPDDTRRVFESVASSAGTALKLPRSRSSVWRELSKALEEAQG
jgi:predicted  nucleic acid-binding Zn-ribbon protein